MVEISSRKILRGIVPPPIFSNIWGCQFKASCRMVKNERDRDWSKGQTSAFIFSAIKIALIAVSSTYSEKVNVTHVAPGLVWEKLTANFAVVSFVFPFLFGCFFFLWSWLVATTVPTKTGGWLRLKELNTTSGRLFSLRDCTNCVSDLSQM